MANTPEARLKIIAENLARAALQELRRDVKDSGTEATGASVGFGKLVFQHGNLIASTANARKGMQLFEGSLRALAFQAAGIPGTVGKAVQGVGMLGIGSLWVTGALAGAGALALAWRVMTRDARAAADASDKLAESLKRQTLGGQFREIQRNLTTASAGVQSANERGAGITANPIWGWISMGRQRALEDAGENAVDAVLAARAARGQTIAQRIRERRLEADAIGVTAEEVARLQAAVLGMTEAQTTEYVAQSLRIERRREEVRVLAAQKDLLEEITAISAEVSRFAAGDLGVVLQNIQVPTLDDILGRTKFGQGVDVDVAQAFVAMRKGAALDFDMPLGKQGDVDGKEGIEGRRRAEGGVNRRAAQMALLGSLSIATSGGGAQGIFGGLGSLVTGVSGLSGISKTLSGPLGWAGFGLSALGSVFGMFDRNEDRRHRELLQAVDRLGETVGLQNATVIVIGPDGHATRRALTQLEDSDAVERIPGPVGATG